MQLVESPECTNCDRRGWDNDAWHTLLEYPAFQLYWEDMMTLQKKGEQPLTPDSLVLIMLKSADGWDQVATFVTLTMHHKMEIMWERQRRPIAPTTQHPILEQFQQMSCSPPLHISTEYGFAIGRYLGKYYLHVYLFCEGHAGHNQ